MQLTTDNHYVPKTYLKNWANGTDRIWSYRTLVSHPTVAAWKHASIRKIAFRSHLYSEAIGEGFTDEFENMFNREYETPAGTVIPKVISGARLTPEDWATLIKYVAAQDVRTPARLEEIIVRSRESLPNILKTTLDEAAQKIEAGFEFNQFKPKYDPKDFAHLPVKVKIEKSDDETYMRLRADALIGRKLFLFTIKHLMTNTVNELLKHKWTILRSPKGLEWYTSDDPVIKLNYYDPKKYTFGGGWGSKGTDIFFPLSPHHMLHTVIGSRPMVRNSYLRYDLAKQLQRFTIEHAHRYVFALTPDDEISRIRPRTIDKEKFDLEEKQWKAWHKEQSAAENELNK